MNIYIFFVYQCFYLHKSRFELSPACRIFYCEICPEVSLNHEIFFTHLTTHCVKCIFYISNILNLLFKMRG